MKDKENKDQHTTKSPAEKELQLDGLSEAFDGEPSGIAGELGKKYVVDESDEDKENKRVKYRNKSDKPEYKGPPDAA
jgi:hypothetical protein